MIHEKADVIEDQMIAKGFADVAEFDEVARRGRLCSFKYSRTHARPLLLMSRSAESNQMFSSAGFSTWPFVVCQV
jgi:hypothetical protein